MLMVAEVRSKDGLPPWRMPQSAVQLATRRSRPMQSALTSHGMAPPDASRNSRASRAAPGEVPGESSGPALGTEHQQMRRTRDPIGGVESHRGVQA